MYWEHERMKGRLPDGLLIMGSGGEVYRLEEGTRRHIVDEAAFYYYKYKWEQIIPVEDLIVDLIPPGRSIKLSPYFIAGAPSDLILRGSGPALYIWTERRLRQFLSPAMIQRLRITEDEVVTVADELLFSLPVGSPVDYGILEQEGPLNGRLYRLLDGRICYGERRMLREVESMTIMHYLRLKPEMATLLTPTESAVCPIGAPVLSDRRG